MAFKPIDSRQIVLRGLLSEIAATAGLTLQEVLTSINFQLEPPLNVVPFINLGHEVLIATSLPSNPDSNIQRSISYINNTVPFLSSATATIPTSPTGNVTTSTGASVALSVTSGQYQQVLLWLDTSSNVGISVGPSFSAGSLAAAVNETSELPLPTANTLPFAYITVFNNAGTVSGLTQSNITQLVGGGSSSGTSVTPARVAGTFPVGLGATSVTVPLSVDQISNSFVVLAQFTNLLDPFSGVEYQPITITAKTSGHLTSSFTATWNYPTNTGDYAIDYVVSAAISQIGEYPIGSGATTLTISLPTPLATGDYVVLAEFTNSTDSNPQFQPILIRNKSSSFFTVDWNMPLDTSNYKLSWQLASYQP